MNLNNNNKFKQKKKDEFISFWRIVYNLFTGEEQEAEFYHASATVSTLLLKLGEATRKFQNETNSRSMTETNNTKNETNIDDNHHSKNATISTGIVNETENNQWSISFEQLLASLLTDNMLVAYFDSKYDLNKKLGEYKSQHA